MLEDEINTHLDQGCDVAPKITTLALKTPVKATGNLHSFIKAPSISSTKKYKTPLNSNTKKNNTQTAILAASPGFDDDPATKNTFSSNQAQKLPKKQKRVHDKPLAELIRPQSLTDYMGQQNLIGAGTMLKSLIDQNKLPNMLLWGPPGCGKTTLARIMGKLFVRNS
jgi:putative ATPase